MNLKAVVGMEIVASKPNGDGKDTTTSYLKLTPIPNYSLEQAKQRLQDYKDNLNDAIIETLDT